MKALVMALEEKMAFAWIFLFFSAIASVHGAFKTGSDFHRSDTAGNRLSYANTDNIGDCARLCLGYNTSCLLIFWSVQNLLPEGNAGENCGPQGTSLSWSDINMLKTIDTSGLKIYINSGINASQPTSSDPDCSSFVYIATGTSRSFLTPPASNSLAHCSIVLVTDENSTLEVSTQFACNGQCFCSDLLRIDNVRISDTRPEAVSACLDPSVNETEVMVTSAEGGFVVLELNKAVTSLASANFTVRSLPTGSLPCVQCDELVKDRNSTLQSVQCHKPKSYVPSCPVNGLTTIAGDTTARTLPSETGTTVDGSAANTTTKTVTNIDNNSIIINNKSNNTNSSSNNKNNKSNNNTSFAVGRQASDGEDPAAADAGVVAGAVVGGILGLLLLVSLGVLAYFRFKRNRVFPGLEKKTDYVLTSAPPAATTVEKRPVITET